MPLNQNDRKKIIELARKHHVEIQEGWQNFTENQRDYHALVLDVETIEELQMLVKAIYDLNASKTTNERIIMRAVAGKKSERYQESFSFTAVTEADIKIRLTGSVFKQIKKTANKHIVSVGPSIQVGELDEKLYKEFNLTLPTSSLIGYVTAAGLAATGGNGTGRDQPSYAGLVHSFTMMLPNGDIVKLDESHPDFHTIRASHLGLFGIVIEQEMCCIDAKKLQRVMETRTLDEVLEEIDGDAIKENDYLSIMNVPTYQKNGKDYIIRRDKPVPTTVADVDNPSWVSHFSQGFMINLQEDIHLTDMLAAHPYMIPYVNRYITSQIEIGEGDRAMVGPWYNLAHYQQAFPRDIDDAGYLFEVSDDYHEVKAAIKKIDSELTRLAKDGIYPLCWSGFYMRFFKGTNHGLSASQHAEGKIICAVDMPSSMKIPGYAAFKKHMQAFFMNELHAKPHWGKYIPDDIDYAKLYGKHFEQFIEALNRWHKEHHLPLEKSPFLNRFFCQHLQLSAFAPHASALPQLTQSASLLDNKQIHKSMKKTLQQINQENEYGKALASELQKHVQAYKQSKAVNNATLFQPMPAVTNKHADEKPKPKCVIL